jgi:hypothetical protein
LAGDSAQPRRRQRLYPFVCALGLAAIHQCWLGSESWYVGLVWADVIAKANALGFAFGQPMKATNTDGDTVCQVWLPPQACRGGRKINADANFHKVSDRNLAFEAYYKIQLSDTSP